jgi:hypothetical protein
MHAVHDEVEITMNNDAEEVQENEDDKETILAYIRQLMAEGVIIHVGQRHAGR